MCLFEKEESNTFPQGGTYDQYRRWIGNHPNLFGVGSLDPFLVWRSCADGCVSSQARSPDEDQRACALRAAAFRALRGDRLPRGSLRLRYQREPTLEAFYEGPQPFAAPFQAFFYRDQPPP